MKLSFDEVKAWDEADFSRIRRIVRRWSPERIMGLESPRLVNAMVAIGVFDLRWSPGNDATLQLPGFGQFHCGVKPCWIDILADYDGWHIRKKFPASWNPAEKIKDAWGVLEFCLSVFGGHFETYEDGWLCAIADSPEVVDSSPAMCICKAAIINEAAMVTRPVERVNGDTSHVRN